jgi:hypothetical protein
VHCAAAQKEDGKDAKGGKSGKKRKVWRSSRHPSNMHIHLFNNHPTVQKPKTSTMHQSKIKDWCLPYMTTNEQWALAFAVGAISYGRGQSP